MGLSYILNVLSHSAIFELKPTIETVVVLKKLHYLAAVCCSNVALASENNSLGVLHE